MAKGYKPEYIKKKLAEILADSKTGLSGSEISEKLGINRVTMAKYLDVFANQGFLREKSIGNVNLWYLQDESEQFQFPDDYFVVQSKLVEILTGGEEHKAYSLFKNCLQSGANISKLVLEVLIPTIEHFSNLYAQGKIGNSELNFQNSILSNSVAMLNSNPIEVNQNKNIVLLSADSSNKILSESVGTAYRSDSWRIFHLGDMSSAIDVIFDLDLQKFLNKFWKKKPGILIILVFSKTEEGMNFFADAVNSIKKKFGKNLFLIIYGKTGKKTSINSDFISDNFETIFQWSQTKFENLES